MRAQFSLFVFVFSVGFLLTGTLVEGQSQLQGQWQTQSYQAPINPIHVALMHNGKILIVAGSGNNAANLGSGNLKSAVLDPATGAAAVQNQSWDMFCEGMTVLPDGRVFISGGGRFDDINAPTDQLSGQFYSPPYLFKGTRPVITSAPSTLQYGQSFTVQTPDAAKISKVSLMRLGAITHGFNVGQRILSLSFTAGTGSLTVTAPANGNSAPPGYYLLFILDGNGVPSTAATVHF